MDFCLWTSQYGAYPQFVPDRTPTASGNTDSADDVVQYLVLKD